MSCASSPIVVLDSGLGGLTVMRALRRALPGEDILYFGDTARVPYGCKSATTVTSFVRQILGYFLPSQPKHAVIACNTATALALPALREEFAGLPISGVIEPGAKAALAAVSHLQRPLIGIIGTEATIRSGAYEKAILRRQPDARVVSRAAPLLVPIIEEGRSVEDPLVQLALRQYLQPMMERSIDALVLGCTHYPLYKDLIARTLGDSVAVIDSADECAQDVRQRLRAANVDRPEQSPTGILRCYVTDESPRFASLAARFLGLSMEPPTLVPLDELSAIEIRA